MTYYLGYYRYKVRGQDEIDDIDQGVSTAFWMIENNTAAPSEIVDENGTVIKTREELDDLIEEYYQKYYG